MLKTNSSNDEGNLYTRMMSAQVQISRTAEQKVRLLGGFVYSEKRLIILQQACKVMAAYIKHWYTERLNNLHINSALRLFSVLISYALPDKYQKCYYSYVATNVNRGSGAFINCQ